MPEARLHRCVEKVKATGKSEQSAYAICNTNMAQTSGESAAHLAPSGGRKRKRKTKRKAKAYHRTTIMSEAMRGKHADILVGLSAPQDLREFVEASVRTCLSGGSDEARCHEQAMLGIRNAGWDHDITSDTWVKGSPRQVTFAERLDGRNVATYYMRDCEIMRPGIWKGQSYAVDDLRRIANDTNEVLSQLRPPMIPEHPGDGRPAKRAAALGWPKGLYVDQRGSLRVRALKGIPAAAAKVLEYGGFGDFSVGLRSYRDQITGKEYPRVLDHLALTNFPVIKTMEGVAAAYEEPAVLAASEDEVQVITFCALSSDGAEEVAMPLTAEDQAAIAALVAKAVSDQVATLKGAAEANLSEAATRLTKLEGENQALREASLARARKARIDEARQFVATLSENGIITHAQRPYEEALAVMLAQIPEDDVVTLSEGDQEIRIHPLNVYKKAVSLRRPAIRVGRESAVRGSNDGDFLKSYLSETDLVAAGHSADDAKRVVDAHKSGSLAMDLSPSLQAAMGKR